MERKSAAIKAYLGVSSGTIYELEHQKGMCANECTDLLLWAGEWEIKHIRWGAMGLFGIELR